MPIVAPNVNVLEEFVLNKCDSFVAMGVWPSGERLKYRKWLKNFHVDDREHALYLLNSFVYYNMDMCVALIRGALLSLTNLIPQVQTLNEHLSNWRQLLADSIFVPVTGESRNITDSGNILAGYLRRELSVPQDNILTVDQLYDSAYSYQLKNSKRIILFDDLKLEFDNAVPLAADYQIAPLILIVFMENAFKHAKFIQSAAVNIYIKTLLQDNWFSLTIKNNYNKEKQSSSNGIGLTNVKRRLEVIYPNGQHQLTISQDEIFYTVTLKLQLVKIGLNN
jgi:hypothetical protein